MSESTHTPLGKESKATAGLGGAGSGTLLVVIANSLAEDHPLRPILVWGAPTFSVFSGAFFLWCQLKLREYLAERRANAVFSSAKQTIVEALANPATSKQHRLRLQGELEKLDLLMIQRQFARIEAISVVPEDTDSDHATVPPRQTAPSASAALPNTSAQSGT